MADRKLQETFRLSRSDAQRRAKQLFREFPPDRYLTEIVFWKDRGEIVEVRIERRISPLEIDDRLMERSGPEEV